MLIQPMAGLEKPMSVIGLGRLQEETKHMCTIQTKTYGKNSQVLTTIGGKEIRRYTETSRIRMLITLKN